jgi:hypothetical protein
MNLHFITSISQEYWNNVAQYCIPTWDLPGRVTVYVEQTDGDIKWTNNIPFDAEIITVPDLVNTVHKDRKKVQKFWGKSYTQINAVRNRGMDERVIWIDADVEQLKYTPEDLFTMKIKEPFAIMNSGDSEDCWESGLVIFNQLCDKLGRSMRRYESIWLDPAELDSLWRPYDAQVLGNAALQTGYHNLCDQSCSNADAFDNSRYGDYFKHWINKENKQKLKELKQEPVDNFDIINEYIKQLELDEDDSDIPPYSS